MESRKLSPLKLFNFSLAAIRSTYESLFVVPEDRGLNIVDQAVSLTQINDTIAFAIQNQVPVQMQINLTASRVVELRGHLLLNRSGRLCIQDQNSNTTQTLEDAEIRSIALI